MGQALNNPLLFRRSAEQDRVLIVGSGLAGLFTALRLSPVPVTILSPRSLGEGASSAWAQGGIAAAIGEGDTPEAHAADTIAAGAGLVDPAIAAILTAEASRCIDDLLAYGVPFDRDLEGKLQVSREAAHSARRIVRVNGDKAGRAVMAALIAAVVKTPSISVLENVQGIQIVKEDGKAVGVYATRSSGGQAVFLPARAVVLATGGLGQLYRTTTNPLEAFGSGLTMAAKAGAIIADPEFVQFHPTGFDIGLDPAPLASEALRGDGALLINSNGERFMTSQHQDGELAPRDIVARGVFREIKAGRGAFLDCRKIDLEKAFPNAFAVCQAAGIDATRQPIPIAPAAHYHMGGVLTDACGRTSIANLWACGEVACTRVHGANRLASNSLLEAVVFGARVAQDVSETVHQWYAAGTVAPRDATTVKASTNPASAKQIAALRRLMSDYVGVERSDAGLTSAVAALLKFEADASSLKVEAMGTSALMIAVAAWTRKESRGAHERSDWPKTAEDAAHTYLDLKTVRRLAFDITGAAVGQAKKTQSARQRRAG